jgi:hypothetical protein
VGAEVGAGLGVGAGFGVGAGVDIDAGVGIDAGGGAEPGGPERGRGAAVAAGAAALERAVDDGLEPVRELLGLLVGFASGGVGGGGLRASMPTVRVGITASAGARVVGVVVVLVRTLSLAVMPMHAPTAATPTTATRQARRRLLTRVRPLACAVRPGESVDVAGWLESIMA